MRKVLVLDANARHALVAIRNLGKYGISITAGSETRFNAGTLSKYVSHRLRYPSPEENTASFLDIVEEELSAGEYVMVLPVRQTTVEIIVRNRDRFEPYTSVPFPPEGTIEFGLDKGKTIEAARDTGVSHPKTVLEGTSDFGAAAAELGFPVVVKPRRGSSRAGVSVCHSRGELERTCRETIETHGPVILQEFIPFGGERGVYMLYDDTGRLVRVTVQHRLRSNPPEGGASTYRETVDDPELIELADRLLSSIGWTGVAMAEFRIDGRTGEPILMEINPRLWGSLALSVFAGVEFPYLLYRMARDEPLEPDLDYAVGVRARCVFRDAQQVLAREDTLRAFGEFLRPSEKPCCFDVLSWDDPLPTLGNALYYASRLRHRIRERRSDGRRSATPCRKRTAPEVDR